MQTGVLGFARLWSTVLGFGGYSIFAEVLMSVLLVIPLAVVESFWIVEGRFHWDSTLHVFMSAPIGFFLVFRLNAAYTRYWEARSYLEQAIASCRSISLLVITQYHRHYGEHGHEVPKCVDDVRRYLMMYYFTTVFRLLDLDVRQPLIEDFVTQQELQLLLRQQSARAITCLKWTASRLAHLEALGYMAPLQLHEANGALRDMIEAYNGLLKIKSAPMAFSVRQLCSAIAVVYVYMAPLPLADAFSAILTQYWSVMMATVLSSLLLGFAILGINQTAAAYEVPWDNQLVDMPMVAMGSLLHTELLNIYADPIPPLMGVSQNAHEADASADLDGNRKRIAGSGLRGGKMKEISGTEMGH